MQLSKYKYSNIVTIIPTISVCKFMYFTEIHIEFLRWVVVVNIKRNEKSKVIQFRPVGDRA